MFRFLALLLLAASVIGCTIPPDERDFYYRGWFNPNRPTSLSEPAHMPLRPNHSVYKTDPLIDN